MRYKNIFFCVFLALAFLGISTKINIAYAQTSTVGEIIIKDLNEGRKNVEETVRDIEAQTNLSATQARELVKTAIDGVNINEAALAETIDGFNEGKIALENFAAVAETLRNIQRNFGDPEALSNLARNVVKGIVPPEIGNALSLVDDFGNINDLGDLENILKNPIVKGALDGLQIDGALPAEITNLVTRISSLSLDVEAFANKTIEEVGEELTQTIQNALPDLSEDIIAAIGLEGLTQTLSLQIFSEFGGLFGLNIAGSVDGKYEIFPRDPKSSAPTKICKTECFCSCQSPIERNHAEIRAHFTDEMIKNRNWMIDVFMKDHVLPAMAMMTNQLSAVSMQHTYAIGRFFDAKHQMETQRVFQQLMAEAHRDYQPSKGICVIGTNVRGLAAAKEKTRVAQTALANRMSARTRKNADSISSAGETSDIASRLDNFKNNYCNVFDNAKGLNWLCQESAVDFDRRNKDINITDTLYAKQTLVADFVNSTQNSDGEDLLAFTTNLFSSELNPSIARRILATPDGQAKAEAFTFMDLRAVLAKRSLAESAFSAIASERVSGEEKVDGSFDESFMKRIVVDLGFPEKEINLITGFSPSYHAQRKVLSSYIFQDPRFYTQLYESAANVSRKDTAIKTLNLSLEDDFFDRQLEEESMFAGMLEIMLDDAHTRASATLGNLETQGDLE